MCVFDYSIAVSHTIPPSAHADGRQTVRGVEKSLLSQQTEVSGRRYVGTNAVSPLSDSELCG